MKVLYLLVLMTGLIVGAVQSLATEQTAVTKPLQTNMNLASEKSLPQARPVSRKKAVKNVRRKAEELKKEDIIKKSEKESAEQLDSGKAEIQKKNPTK